MFLKEIEISNFKAIDNKKIEFKEGLNLIIGDNGVGKTSILEAISVALGGFIAGIDGINTKHFTKDEIRCVSELMGQGSYNIKHVTPIEVSCNVEVDNEEFTWTRRKSSIHSSRSTVEPRDICKKAAIMADDSNSILPLLSYQSVARMWAQRREKSKNIFREDYSRTVGYIDCLSEESNNKLFMNWCKRMEQISWQEDRKIAEYEVVKQTLAKFMSIMNEDKITKVFYDKRTEELMYKNEEEVLPISYLSAGYQSLIWMVLEIAYRMAVLNPNLLDKVTEKTSGIVLIDELDLHLHPNWQWKVIKALRETFPKVQFIATTHSPIILASCKDERVIAIDSEMNIEYKNSLYGMPINNVLVSYQSSTDIVDSVKKKLDKFNEAIDGGDLKGAKKLLDELKEEVGEDNPEFVGANVTYDLESMDMED